MSRCDVLIIGAGLSALETARTLQTRRPSPNVVILEARDRVGGRADTHSYSLQGPHVDLGCSMIHGYHEGNPAKQLLETLGIVTHSLYFAAQNPHTTSNLTLSLSHRTCIFQREQRDSSTATTVP